jgi:hypothetical protein
MRVFVCKVNHKSEQAHYKNNESPIHTHSKTLYLSREEKKDDYESRPYICKKLLISYFFSLHIKKHKFILFIIQKKNKKEEIFSLY